MAHSVPPDDDDSMRRAFEQFMISGRTISTTAVGHHKEKEDDDRSLTSTSTIPQPPRQQEVVVVWKKRAEKRYWQILNAFQGTLERDWLEVDDNLQGVLSSISNLRSRIAMSSRLLCNLTNSSKTTRNKQEWNGCGYRNNDNVDGGLTVDDVNLALSHDLVQHEKMMAGARTLLASLSEAQEALARRLDELMLHHLDTMHHLTTRGSVAIEATSSQPPSSLSVVMNAVDKLQCVFTSLALELYRKQVLIQSVLDALNDDLLVRDQEEEEKIDDVGMDVNPRSAAERCLREWPRGSTSSHVDVEMLNGLLLLGERGDRRKA